MSARMNGPLTERLGQVLAEATGVTGLLADTIRGAASI